MATATLTLLTLDEFAALPDDERCRYELVDGKLVKVASATLEHNFGRDEMRYEWTTFLRRTGLGHVVVETDFRTGPRTARRPDLLYYGMDRWRQLNPRRIPLLLAPHVAVEFLSPSESAIDVGRKVREYLAAGCIEVWLIDLINRQITICTATATRVLGPEETLTTELLPGFALSVATVVGPVLP